MVVNTASPAVIEARKTNLELLLANHPEDCLTCNKNGDCRLQDYAYYYGVKQDAFKGEKHNYPIEDDNPFIVRDMNKCILCGKCIRMCEEVQGNNVINLHSEVLTQLLHRQWAPITLIRKYPTAYSAATAFRCVRVGALSEKAMIGKGRRWEIQK
jgi:formate dehydrogenase alpha subunit